MRNLYGAALALTLLTGSVTTALAAAATPPSEKSASEKDVITYLFTEPNDALPLLDPNAGAPHFFSFHQTGQAAGEQTVIEQIGVIAQGDKANPCRLFRATYDQGSSHRNEYVVACKGADGRVQVYERTTGNPIPASGNGIPIPFK